MGPVPIPTTYGTFNVSLLAWNMAQTIPTSTCASLPVAKAALPAWRIDDAQETTSEKRTADVIGNAAHVTRIATGESEDALPKTRHAEGGKFGGGMQAESWSATERKDIARKAK
jgi:hypothetical protein